MYKILEREVLGETVKLMVVEAPQVVRRAQAGQFVIVRLNEEGERIPLTIADLDREAGSVTLVIREVGATTMRMGAMQAGEELATVVGPLGHPSEIRKYGRVVCVGGGAGIASLYPIVHALKQAGNLVTSILGARTGGLIFWQDRMRDVSDRLILTTDDGSLGLKGVVTEPLKELLEAGDKPDRLWAVGPAIMMKRVAEVTRPFGIPTVASLNTIMIDGTGMCGGCRVVVGESTKFACMDGPEFDAHKVNWEITLSRLAYYREQEKIARERWEHECMLDAVALEAVG